MRIPLRFLTGTLAFLLVGWFGAAAHADSIAIVRVATAKVRSSPGEGRRAVTLLDRGDKARITGRRGDWVRIELASGTRGWIREDLVRVSTVATPAKPARKRTHGVPRARHSAPASVASRAASPKPAVASKPGKTAQAPKTASKRTVETEPKVVPPAVESASNIVRDEAGSLPSTIDSSASDEVLVVLPEAEVALESEDRIARARASLIDDAMMVFKSENEPVRSTTRRTALVSRAKSLRGTPYRFGATGRGSFDCSGFTQHLYRRQGISIPRTASEQFHSGVPVGRMSLRQGDLVFFRNTGGRRGISHVGMFLGNGKFIHASSRGRGVRIDGLTEAYYSAHFSGARRMLK